MATSRTRNQDIRNICISAFYVSLKGFGGQGAPVLPSLARGPALSLVSLVQLPHTQPQLSYSPSSVPQTPPFQPFISSLRLHCNTCEQPAVFNRDPSPLPSAERPSSHSTATVGFLRGRSVKPTYRVLILIPIGQRCPQRSFSLPWEAVSGETHSWSKRGV